MHPHEQRTFAPPSLVDLSDETQANYWAVELDASPDKIERAIREVGPYRTAIEICLGSRPVIAPLA